MNIPLDLVQEMIRYDFICGSDEVGYGAWAGKLTVCAAIVPRTWAPPDIVRDSKQLTKAKREKAYVELVKTVTHHLVHVDVDQIDSEGVGKVILKAHAAAIQGAINLHHAQGHTGLPYVIVDGTLQVVGAYALPKADALIPAVSAASIIAKVTRDRYMAEMDAQYPGYNFAQNAGYGTPQHRRALTNRGVCAIHRKSYAPIAEFIRRPSEPGELWMDPDLW